MDNGYIPMKPCRRRASRAFTLAEAMLSSLVVGLMLVGALEAVRSVHQINDATLKHAKGKFLAEDLLSEIVKLDYGEPVDADSGMGLDAGEAGGNRILFDDVDDYHNWSPPVPEDVGGNPIAGMEGWRRSVVVEHVSPNDLSMALANHTGVKRITVTVTYKGEVVASLQSIRTDAVQTLMQYEMAQGITNSDQAVSAGDQEYDNVGGLQMPASLMEGEG